MALPSKAGDLSETATIFAALIDRVHSLLTMMQ
jgi:hypothetical protein